ncbi:MAG: AAA family ATPase [Thermoanaerobaculia bacterium]|nr:AAA family ATPase [Thermoanaerobaculia bacterium]
MIYAFGPYELDTRVYELRRSGTVRPVEPQVFDVLAYLARHRDRLVSKEELLEKLWPDRFVSETTLTSRVKEARKAVGDTGEAQAVIRTQRGRGYRFVAKVEERGEPSPPPFEATTSGDQTSPGKSVAGESPVASPSIGVSAAPRSRTGFVGRARELDRLVDSLRRALKGSRQIVFVTAEAGVGKTTLVEAFLSDTAAVPDLLVARGQCVEHRGSGEPYMPLLDAFARLADLRESSLLVECLKTDAPSWVVQMPSLVSDGEVAELRARSGASGERMLRELGMLVDRLTASHPMIVLLEDLHWSDYATLDAIDALARQSAPARLLIVGTWRPSDVKAARHPVYALTQELRVRGQCEVVALPEFDREELVSYLAMRFGGARFGESLAPILHARTGGNALFVRNLVDSWIDRGLVRRRDDVWTLEADLADLERDVPDSLRHLIENQLAELEPEQQRILETACVIGREFPIALVAGSLPASDDDLEREFERLEREEGIVRAAGTEHWGDGSLTSRYSFVHDLYVDVLYRRLPAVRRTRVHQQVGLELERAWHGRESQHAPELALHFQRGLDRHRGPRYLQSAAEQAIERNAYREAVDHLTAALELLAGAPPSAERDCVELQLRCKLAPSLVATRGWADVAAEDSYLRARQLAEELADAASLSQTLYGLANMYEYRGEYVLAERIAEERMTLDAGGCLARSLESHELLTCSLLHQGRYGESVRHGEEAVKAWEGLGPNELDLEALILVVQAHGWTSGSLHFAGRADDALSHSARAIAMASQSGNELARASAHIQAAFLHFYRGETDRCAEMANAGAAIAREFRFPFHVACARVLLGWTEGVQGHFAEAVREIRAGIRTSEAIGARMDLPVFHAILALVLERAGEKGAALEALDLGIALVTRGRSFFYAPELYRQYGVILAASGPERREEGCAAIRRALEMADAQECPFFALRALANLASLEGNEWVPRLREAAGRFTQGLDTLDLRNALLTLDGAA